MGISPADINGAFASGDLNAYNSLAQSLPSGGSYGTNIPGIPGLNGNGMDALTRALQGTGKLGFNVPTIGLGLNALSSLVGGIAAFKQLGLANKQFEYTKKTTDANMANQIKTYNTALADKARSRAATEGQSQATADEYVTKNSLAKGY